MTSRAKPIRELLVHLLIQPWVTLVVAAMGFVATIAGVLITQHRSDRREKENYERERERERERWAREDAARTFERKRAAYSDFYESLREMGRTVYSHGMGMSESEEPELPFEWNLPTFRKLQHLELYASTTVGVGGFGSGVGQAVLGPLLPASASTPSHQCDW